MAAEAAEARRRTEAAAEEEKLLWATSEPMQPTPLLLSAEEGGRVLLFVHWSRGGRPAIAPPRVAN